MKILKIPKSQKFLNNVENSGILKIKIIIKSLESYKIFLRIHDLVVLEKTTKKNNKKS